MTAIRLTLPRLLLLAFSVISMTLGAAPARAQNAGDAMVAHICMVFTLRDGRVIAQRNYDCYEDFSV